MRSRVVNSLIEVVSSSRVRFFLSLNPLRLFDPLFSDRILRTVWITMMLHPLEPSTSSPFPSHPQTCGPTSLRRFSRFPTTFQYRLTTVVRNGGSIKKEGGWTNEFKSWLWTVLKTYVWGYLFQTEWVLLRSWDIRGKGWGRLRERCRVVVHGRGPGLGSDESGVKTVPRSEVRVPETGKKMDY